MKKIFTVILVATICFTMSGCAVLDSQLNDLRGDITGNTYTIDTFSNFGEKTMTTHGQKINVSSNIVEERTYSSEGYWETTETLSSAITITIDGNQMISCGDTCIFYEDGLEPEYEFPNNFVNSVANNLFDNTIFSTSINNFKNLFGKPMIVVIKSQMGSPIYAFSGNDVYWEIPDNLPKFTKLSIDGKALYIHRANFQIIDRELLN